MAKSNKNHMSVGVVAGVTHFECEVCGGTSKVTLTFGEAQAIRAAGGGTANAICLSGSHGHTVKYQVWNPRQES